MSASENNVSFAGVQEMERPIELASEVVARSVNPKTRKKKSNAKQCPQSRLPIGAPGQSHAERSKPLDISKPISTHETVMDQRKPLEPPREVDVGKVTITRPDEYRGKQHLALQSSGAKIEDDDNKKEPSPVNVDDGVPLEVRVDLLNVRSDSPQEVSLAEPAPDQGNQTTMALFASDGQSDDPWDTWASPLEEQTENHGKGIKPALAMQSNDAQSDNPWEMQFVARDSKVTRPKPANATSSTEVQMLSIPVERLSESELQDRVGIILHSHARRLSQSAQRVYVEGKDFDLVLSVLRRHPNASSKIGCGVHAIFVAKTAYGSFCYHAQRRDSSIIDFSYRKCLNHSHRGNTGYEASKPHARYTHDACRRKPKFRPEVRV